MIFRITECFRILIPVRYKTTFKKSSFFYYYRLFIEKRILSADRGGLGFSKFNEAQIALEFLPEKYGFYVDVGAGAPVEASNTFAFYARGWRGICMDPISINERLHKRIRPADIFIKTLVGATRQEVIFYEFAPWGYSTTVKESADKLSRKPGVFLIRSRTMLTVPLSEIVPSSTPEQPSLLSIDAEGSDLEILKSNNFKVFSPRVIICEDYKIYSENQASTDIDIFLEKFDYTLVKTSGYSKIFVHKTYLN
jgi:FkbM family methyltransferase